MENTSIRIKHIFSSREKLNSVVPAEIHCDLEIETTSSRYKWLSRCSDLFYVRLPDHWHSQ